MPAMNAPVKAVRVETPAEKLAWVALKKQMRLLGISRAEQKFTIPGYIVSLSGDPEDPTKPIIKDNKKYDTTGKKPTRAVLLATCKTTLPGCEMLEFRRDVGYSFYDGYRRGSSERGPLHMRGGLWHVHYSVTGQEVPKELVDSKVGFDTDDYCGPQHPVLLRFEYKGPVEEGSDYYGTRGNINLKLDGFEPDPDAVGGGELPEDDEAWLGGTEDMDGKGNTLTDDDELPL